MMDPWDESGIPFTYVKNPLKNLESHNNPITPKWATKTKHLHPWKLTCPLKMDYFSREYIFQPLIFRGHASFRGFITFYYTEVDS